MNIADLRTKYPGFSDDEIIGALQRVKYPDYSTDEVAKVVGYEKPSEFGKGFKRSFAEVPGMAAGVVAYGADLVGADDTRDSLLGYAARRQQQVERDYGSEAASFTSVTEGKASPIDFLANASGYVIGQGLQAITTGGLTALGFKAMAKDEPDWIGSDCPMAGHHIAQGMQQAGTPAKALQHPLSLVRYAYGLE